MEAVWRSLGLIVTGLFFAALIALIAVSVEQGYTVVLKSLLTSNGLSKIFWIGALIAAVIPVAFLMVYSCVLFVMCGDRVWRFISRQTPP